MFDFDNCSNIISQYFDTDYIDIRRNISGTLTEIYSNIPCHISYNNTDNPDPTAIDVTPIITSLTINMPNWVDVRNDDYIVAKKMSGSGDMQSVYSGRCGEPAVSQNRKKIIITMQGTEAETPTPTPPKEYIEVTVNYLTEPELDDDGNIVTEQEQIQDAVTIKIAQEGSLTISAPEIEGYVFVRAYIDGVLQESADIYIADVGEENHEIVFEYTGKVAADWLRFLINGLYTKDNGAMAKGWHLYKRIKVYNSEQIEDTQWRVECAREIYTHEETGEKLTFTAGRKIVLIPSDTYLEIEEIESETNTTITFLAAEFEPTAEQQVAYVCGWYG